MLHFLALCCRSGILLLNHSTTPQSMWTRWDPLIFLYCIIWARAMSELILRHTTLFLCGSLSSLYYDTRNGQKDLIGLINEHIRDEFMVLAFWRFVEPHL
ncbi:hypothetical protein BDW75DRAFT_214206 [Aspergillus navahoensis]